MGGEAALSRSGVSLIAAARMVSAGGSAMFAPKAAIEEEWCEMIPGDGMMGSPGEFCPYRAGQAGRGDLSGGQPEPVSSYLYKQINNSGSSTIASRRLSPPGRSMRSEMN